MIYRTKLITWSNFNHMKKILLIVFLVFILFPISSSFSQQTTTPSSLGIALTSFAPFHYKDEGGYTVIIGEVENTKNFPVTEVRILGLFYDEFTVQPLEAKIGTTIIDVIPPFGKAPYIIKSLNPNASITNVSVKLQGFNSAPPKNEELSIESEISELGEQLKITGQLTNNSSEEASQTKIHLVFYDVFQPPRIIWISTIQLEEAIEGGSSADFEFNEKLDQRSIGYKIFAESENAYSNIQDVLITHPDVLTKLITINDISISDDEGNKLSDVSKDSSINIQSNIVLEYATNEETFVQPFVYYVQIKQSGKIPFVEFIGVYEGVFHSTDTKLTSVEWIPENQGLYFIETFVWDPKGIPLASQGPIMIMLVT